MALMSSPGMRGGCEKDNGLKPLWPDMTSAPHLIRGARPGPIRGLDHLSCFLLFVCFVCLSIPIHLPGKYHHPSVIAAACHHHCPTCDACTPSCHHHCPTCDACTPSCHHQSWRVVEPLRSQCKVVVNCSVAVMSIGISGHGSGSSWELYSPMPMSVLGPVLPVIVVLSDWRRTVEW